MAVTSLLAEGAGPNVVDGYGWGALHFAIPLGGSDVVSVLFMAGADPNRPAVDGLAALHLAARQTGPAAVSALLAAGADPNAVAGEEEVAGTPLHVAALWSNEPSIVLMLLDGGAHPMARDENGRRPVDAARVNEAITGSAGYPRVTGDGVGWGFGYYDEWTYSAAAGQGVMITQQPHCERATRGQARPGTGMPASVVNPGRSARRATPHPNPAVRSGHSADENELKKESKRRDQTHGEVH